MRSTTLLQACAACQATLKRFQNEGKRKETTKYRRLFLLSQRPLRLCTSAPNCRLLEPLQKRLVHLERVLLAREAALCDVLRVFLEGVGKGRGHIGVAAGVLGRISGEPPEHIVDYLHLPVAASARAYADGGYAQLSRYEGGEQCGHRLQYEGED